jgi:hypothetical protein
MKRNIGIWIDSRQAVIVILNDKTTSLKRIPSNIESRVRIPGESKKYGRFGGQFLTFEKNRLMKKNRQTSQFLKVLVKEILPCDALVIFGPSNMKKILEKEVLKNIQLASKLQGVCNAELLTDNQMIAWVKKFYKSNS